MKSKYFLCYWKLKNYQNLEKKWSIQLILPSVALFFCIIFYFIFFSQVKFYLETTFHHYIASLLDMLQSLLTVSTDNIFTTMFLPINLCYSREGTIFKY